MKQIERGLKQLDTSEQVIQFLAFLFISIRPLDIYIAIELILGILSGFYLHYSDLTLSQVYSQESLTPTSESYL